MSNHSHPLPERLAGAGPSRGGEEARGRGTIPPGCVGLPEVIAQGAAAAFLGVLSGQLPLKTARAAHDLGTLTLRGVVIGAEYGATALPALPAASAEALAETLAPARRE